MKELEDLTEAEQGVLFIVIPLEDKEHEALSKVKGNQSWRDFIMQLAKKDKKVIKNEI